MGMYYDDKTLFAMDGASHDITNKDYREHPAIAQSDIKAFMRSPVEYFLRKHGGLVQEDSPTPAQQFGRTVERFIYCGMTWTDEDVVIAPADTLTKSGARGPKFREYEKRIKQDLPCARVVTQKEFDQENEVFEMIAENIRASKNARNIVSPAPGVGQTWHQRIIWNCPVSAVQRKAELDMIISLDGEQSVIVDVKTTSDVSPDGFAREMAKWRYDIQAHSYVEAFCAMTQSNVPPRFLFLAIQNRFPYDCAVYEIHPEWIESGALDSYEALKQIAGLDKQTRSAWVRNRGKVAILVEPTFAKYARIQERAIFESLTEKG